MDVSDDTSDGNNTHSSDEREKMYQQMSTIASMASAVPLNDRSLIFKEKLDSLSRNDLRALKKSNPITSQHFRRKRTFALEDEGSGLLDPKSIVTAHQSKPHMKVDKRIRKCLHTIRSKNRVIADLRRQVRYLVSESKEFSLESSANRKKFESTFNLWKEINSGPFAEEAMHGFAYTEKQLNCARNSLTMEWSTDGNRWIRRRIPDTVTEDNPRGILVPAIPSAATLR
jgi:hypothetical protein